MYEGDGNLEHWNQGERDAIAQEVKDLVLKLTAQAKTLNAREVLFESYLALIWLSADISVFTYKDFLEYVADMNTRYLAKIDKQFADAKAELAEEGAD
jgi:hypothetical protein